MKLLLVEDEKRMAQALCELLRLEKYDVDYCADGADGLDAIETGILRKEKNHAVLAVFNGGDEIPADQRDFLFERFYRTDTARTGENNHYGLGLAIAKAIVSSHKGSIHVRCYDKKVEFYAKIPLQK